ncbi:MAG: hypothetical protein AB7O67_11545 [Vicinamibacterales bacterium]
MWRDHAAAAWLGHVRRRFRMAALADAVTAAAAAGGGAGLLLVLAGMPAHAPVLAATAALGAGLVTATRGWRRWTTPATARVADRRASLDNLLVTAEELDRQRMAVQPSVVDAIWRRLDERTSAVAPSAIAPLVLPAARGALTGLVALALLWSVARPDGPGLTDSLVPAAAAAGAVGIDGLVVVTTPPAYAGLETESATDPGEVRALTGSELRLDVTASGDEVLLVGDGAAVPLVVEGGGRFHTTLDITESTSVILRPRAADGRTGRERLLTITAVPDAPPTVRISAPARDVRLEDPSGRVVVEMDAGDDIGLRRLSLSYTRVSGAGENFSFTEGEVPVVVSKADVRSWHGRAVLDLAALGLQDGDAIVYRARVTDGRPGADSVQSSSYLVEIGREGGASSEGFALPKDEEREGLSQQMLIIHTEALEKRRGSLSAEAWTEETQRLAAEQRMVRAEFVFMTGGEVEDEVAEAEQSHELAEGRLENSSQIELLTAIRAMSRAESALNDGDTTTALVHEREGLAALQRAFARRRYFLRTTPERARIDLERRLSGDRAEASSWTRTLRPEDAATIEVVTALVRELASGTAGAIGAPLAARVAAFDPAWPELQEAARTMVNAATAPARDAARDTAIALLVQRARERLAPPPVGQLPRDPLAGAVSAARPREGTR